MQHRVIEGRVYRVVPLPAADVHQTARHISAQPPTPEWERKAIREGRA